MIRCSSLSYSKYFNKRDITMELLSELKYMFMIFAFLPTYGIHGVKAEETISVNVVRGDIVQLTCDVGTFNGTVTWTVKTEQGGVEITSCTANQDMCDDTDIASYLAGFSGMRDETASILSINTTENTPPSYECQLDGKEVQSFRLNFIILTAIQAPLCSISPFMYDITMIQLSCKVQSLQAGVNHHLQISVIGEPVTNESSNLVYNINTTLYKNASKPVCKLSLEDVSETWTCLYPSLIDIIPTAKGADWEFECLTGEGVTKDQISWELLGPNSEEIDISARYWTRREGRSLLLREVTVNDDESYIQCLVRDRENTVTNISVGFYGIDVDDNGVPSTTRGKDADQEKNNTTYKTLFAVFFILWVLTVAVIVAWFMYPKAKSHWHPSTFTSRFRYPGNHRSEGEGREVGHDMPEKKVGNTSTNEGNHNNSSSNDISTRGKDTSITSSSALTKDTLQSEASAVDNPLYFCVDRSPPTTRSWGSGDEHGAGDVDPEGAMCDELDPSGYDYVGTPQNGIREGMHHEVDNDVYAEVGKNQCLYGKVKK